MRKLVIILIAFLAVVTFIRAVDNSDRQAVSLTEMYEQSPDSTF